MKLNDSSQNAIREAIKKALARFKNENVAESVTDLHLQPLQETGKLIIFDDNDDELSHAHVSEWTSYEGDDFEEQLQAPLTSLLNELREQGVFETANILKPYSVVMVDEQKETLAELLLIDDDTMLLTDELLKGLDEELNAFLKDLLEK